MASQLDIIQEAVRRGIALPPEKQALYNEAVKRGLIEDQRVGVAEDVAKSVPTGLTQGTVGLGNIGGDIGSFVRNKVLSWGGVSPEQIDAINGVQSEFGIGIPATSGQVMKRVEEVTGPLHQSQTVPGNYAQTIAQFIPGSLLGGGSWASKAGSALLGGGSSEAAGQYFKGTPVEPYARVVAGLLGSLGGGMAGDKLSGATPAKPVPIKELDELRDAKTKAYQAVDNAGISYSPSDYSDMLMDIYQTWWKMKFNPTRHSTANDFIKTLHAERGKNLTLTQLDQLRQNVYRDVINSGDDANAAFGRVIVDKIDEMIDNVAPQAGAADPSVASGLISNARSANIAFKTSESVMTKLDRATRQAAKTGKGTNQDNALRQKVDELINEKNGNPFKRYSKDVQNKMREIVMGTKSRNAARKVGSMAPTGVVSATLGSGSGASAGAALGALLGGPPGAAVGGALGGFGVPAVGQVAKMIADSGTRNAVDDLLRIIQANGDAVAAGVNNPSLLGQNIPAGLLGGESAMTGNRVRSRSYIKR